MVYYANVYFNVDNILLWCSLAPVQADYQAGLIKGRQDNDIIWITAFHLDDIAPFPSQRLGLFVKNSGDP